MSGKEQEKPLDRDVPIAPVMLDRATHVDDESRTKARSAAKRVVVVTMSIVLFFLVLTVAFVLPRYVPTEAPLADRATTAPVPEDDDPTPVAQALDPEETAELRRSNQAQLDQALTLVAQLETRNVKGWAETEFDAAKRALATGEQAYTEQRYTASRDVYAEAIETLRAIAARTDVVVAQAVEQGFLQIASSNSNAAREAFEFALSIESGHAEAAKGLARAKTLDQVLALVNEAEGYEALGNLNQARQRYRDALALDAQAPGAASAIARIKRVQLDTDFRRVMSEGFAALDAKRYARAKSAFERAKKIKPSAAEAARALTQVENRILANRISQHLSAAITLGRQEKWADAAKQYRSAVGLDPDLDGAATSATRADARATLDGRLESMIGRPHRLGSDAVHNEAQVILGQARSISESGPRLSRQIEQLTHAIKVARTPIAVTLVSDSATDVTLYTVGSLGRFERHSLSIIPGRYVVVGRRDGFRDARVEFEVSPEHRDAMITVRCEEKLAFGS